MRQTRAFCGVKGQQQVFFSLSLKEKETHAPSLCCLFFLIAPCHRLLVSPSSTVIHSSVDTPSTSLTFLCSVATESTRPWTLRRQKTTGTAALSTTSTPSSSSTSMASLLPPPPVSSRSPGVTRSSIASVRASTVSTDDPDAALPRKRPEHAPTAAELGSTVRARNDIFFFFQSG